MEGNQHTGTVSDDQSSEHRAQNLASSRQPSGVATGSAAANFPGAPFDIQGGPGPVTDFRNPAEVQREYETLAKNLNQIKIDKNLVLRDSKQGLKGQDDRSAATVIAKCGRYVENALRWLHVQQPGQTNSDDFRQLFTILVAQLNFLQAEHSALVVKGQFDKDTSDLFKCLEGNSSQFTPSALQNLRAAAEITAARHQVSQPSTRGQRGGRGYRGHGYRGRDVFGNFGNRGFPNQRPQGQGSDNQHNPGASDA